MENFNGFSPVEYVIAGNNLKVPGGTEVVVSPTAALVLNAARELAIGIKMDGPVGTSMVNRALLTLGVSTLTCRSTDTGNPVVRRDEV